jgi:hypothetical protein
MLKDRWLRACLLTSGCCGALIVGCGQNAKVEVGNNAMGRAAICIDSPAYELFENSLCVCGDLGQVGSINVSRSEPSAPATMGVNGNVDLVASARVDGAFEIGQSLTATASLHTTQNLEVAADMDFVGTMTVGGDLAVGRDLSGVGTLDVDGSLRVAGSEYMVGSTQAAGRGAYQAPTALPCGCDDASILDVAELVADAKMAADVVTLGEQFSIGVTELTLTSGRYYLPKSETVGSIRIVADGAVALYVDGPVASVGSRSVELTDGSTLDLFVAGDVTTVGAITLNESHSAKDFRLYVGGAQTVQLATVGTLSLRGSIYAPRAVLSYVGSTVIEGSLFVQALDGVGSLDLNAARPGSPSGEDCGPAGPDDGGGSADPGTSDTPQNAPSM